MIIRKLEKDHFPTDDSREGMMSRNKFLAFLFLSICLLWPPTAGAQSSVEISREFAAKSIGNELFDDLCGNLEITAGTGWLFVELTLSSYIEATSKIYGGKDLLDRVYFDCGPYYLPDLFLKNDFWPRTEMEPKKAVAGQPLKYTFKAKLGRDLKPFIMKICKSAKGSWRGQNFNQYAQAVGIKAYWVAGDKDPGNPPSTPPASAELTGTWIGFNAKEENLGENKVTQDGKSITFVHPNGQITRGGYIVDATSIFVPVWGSKGIINSSRTRIDFQGGSLNGIHLIRK
jgi:hypothetical protein